MDNGGPDIDGLDNGGLDNGGLDNDGRMCAQATELKLQNVRMTEADALRCVLYIVINLYAPLTCTGLCQGVVGFRLPFGDADPLESNETLWNDCFHRFVTIFSNPFI